MTPLVLHHDQCRDGLVAAWAAWRFFGDCADYMPARYGMPVPDSAAGREVYLLDFSFKRPAMLALLAAAEKVVVLDHHDSAEKELAGLQDVWSNAHIVFDMDRSGASLAWKHFFPGDAAPWLVSYAEDRDLWRFKLPRSREVNAAFASYPADFATCDWLVRAPNWNAPPAELITEGTGIVRYQDMLIASHVKHARDIVLDGHRGLETNATVLNSEIAGKLAERADFGAVWREGDDGRRYWSLRSRDGGADVSAICVRRGGGGHVRASGFSEG